VSLLILYTVNAVSNHEFYFSIVPIGEPIATKFEIIYLGSYSKSVSATMVFRNDLYAKH
jgi:hypothetical protein